MITVRHLLLRYKTKRKIADVFGVEPSAITSWGMDKPIPGDRERQYYDEILPNENNVSLNIDFNKENNELLKLINGKLEKALSLYSQINVDDDEETIKIKIHQNNEAMNMVFNVYSRLPRPDAHHISSDLRTI